MLTCLLLLFFVPAEFYAALGAGSWLQVLPTATHTSFSNIPDSLCGKGSTSPQVRRLARFCCCNAWGY